MKLTRTKLSKAAEITSSKRIYMSDYTNYGIPFYRSKEIIDLFNHSKIQDILYISEQKYEVIKSHFGVPQKGDILFTSVGTICIPYLVRDNEKFYFKDGNLTWFKRFSPEVKPEFIFYLFQSPSIKKRIINYSKGSSQSAITIETLKEIELDFPPIEYQEKIASILSSYDDLIDTNRRRIQLLEEAARLLFREWFVYFRFPGHEKVKIVDGVPEGWKKEHLSKLVSTQYGYTETASQEEIGPKFLRGKDINKTSYIDWSSVPYCSNKKLDFRKYSLSRGDILIVRMADPGKVGIVEVEIEAIFATYLVRLKVINKSISSYYLFYSLLNDKYQGFITGSSTGSTRKSASAKLLVDYYLLIPKKEIIDSFGEQIIPIRKDITILLQQNQKLAQVRDLLLPRLMSGEIEV